MPGTPFDPVDPDNRREFLRFLLQAAATLPLGLLPASAPQTPSLRSLAGRSGRIFGSTAYTRFGNGTPGSFDDPRYLSLLTQECAMLVPANELKWNRLQRQMTAPDFSPADRIVRFAETNGMKVRGHCLVWQNVKRMPAWLASYNFGGRAADAAARLVQDHVTTICKRYGDRVLSYDVVNEAVDSTTGDLRDTPLSHAAGGVEPLLDIAFHAARAAAPAAELVYNDYMGWQSDSAKHRDGVLRLLEGFKKRGTPVDALGCQSHLFAGSGGMAQGARVADPGAWRSFLDEVVGMGYRILVTELDVNDLWLPADIATRDRLCAEVVGAYLDQMLSYRQLRTVVAWDLVDRYSYQQTDTKRRDRLPHRPCPYDDDYQPKPIRAAIARSLAAASPAA